MTIYTIDTINKAKNIEKWYAALTELISAKGTANGIKMKRTVFYLSATK